MTRRDYVAIADEFDKQVTIVRALGHARAGIALRDAIIGIANVMSNDNPRFQRVTFYRHCGLIHRDGIGWGV